ncbi:RagB/SusD family nutrient uptake outer membrane protein [Mucilaginibacter corticis]|uniref:RagB/SusD family nutrient uptake outer membrane protein n=1 Tax=Mucilaginibacter corticis TaxID=2597670 RepID=A0A556M921_9SPHI|nr:RagB/SusD family nutrient uptake outer membrane protein [Mucilaginibacter corticis]TSJ36424.1 RagB/SusD family nutrient uptake outer membrane protein [Mucilaginibacter corticis]
MKKLTKYTTSVLLFLSGILVLAPLSSCKKLIVANPSGTKLLTSTVFTDSLTAQAAVAGMYNSMSYSGSYNFDMAVLPGFSADELTFIGNNYNQYLNNTIPTNDPGNSVWAASYGIIYQANAIINGVPGSGKLSAKFKNQVLGEALFVRAFCYFYLTNYYGDVPLVTTTELSVNQGLARAPAAAVYAQIIADLKLAQSYLPADFTPSGGTDRTRANRFAATALLARVYLYQSDWVNAEAESSAVISSSMFVPATDLSSVFSTTSHEAILQLYNQAGGYVQFAYSVVPNPVTPVPAYVLTAQQIAAFQAGDKRFTAWTASLAYSGNTYVYPYKYKNVSGGNTEYYTLLRISEQYLIRAEARAQQGNTSGAITDLNAIHNPSRVNLPVYAGATDQASVLSAIMNERRVELFAEWGHRWFDLKRTHTADAVLGAEKPTWTPAAALYPVPVSEIKLNPKLVQNPGYH